MLCIANADVLLSNRNYHSLSLSWSKPLPVAVLMESFTQVRLIDRNGAFWLNTLFYVLRVSPCLNEPALSGFNRIRCGTFLFHSACVHSLCSFEFTTASRGKVIFHRWLCVIVKRETADICLPTVIISDSFVFIQLKLLPAEKHSGEAKVWKCYRLEFSLFKSQFEGIFRPNSLPLSDYLNWRDWRDLILLSSVTINDYYNDCCHSLLWKK